MLLRDKYLSILSRIAPTGAAGIALLLGSTMPSNAARYSPSAEPLAGNRAGVGERLADLLTTIHASDPGLFDPGTVANELSRTFGIALTVAGVLGGVTPPVSLRAHPLLNARIEREVARHHIHPRYDSQKPLLAPAEDAVDIQRTDVNLPGLHGNERGLEPPRAWLAH